MSDINDRENRGHSKGLEKALVYGGYATVAPQPSRARVQRDECFYAAFGLRERRVQDSPFLHVRLCSEAQ